MTARRRRDDGRPNVREYLAAQYRELARGRAADLAAPWLARAARIEAGEPVTEPGWAIRGYLPPGAARNETFIIDPQGNIVAAVAVHADPSNPLLVTAWVPAAFARSAASVEQ